MHGADYVKGVETACGNKPEFCDIAQAQGLADVEVRYSYRPDLAAKLKNSHRELDDGLESEGADRDCRWRKQRTTCVK